MARVCMVAFTDYPVDTRVRREAEALVQRGDEVDFICLGTPSLGDRRSLNGVSLHPVMRFVYTDGARPRDYVWRYFTFQLAAFFRILGMQLRRPYDVVHVNTMPDSLVFSAVGAKLLGAKVILDVHDLVPELYASKFGLDEGHWIIRLLRWVERRSVGFADRAIAVHLPHLEALVRHGNPREKFTVLMNVPDSGLFRPRVTQPPESPFTLIYHGSVGNRHGLDVAVRAAALARSAVPDLELLIVGDGDFFPQVRAVVEELGVQHVVRLNQQLVPIEELLPIIRQASVGLVPILDDPFTRYMLPVKLLEYVALGIPVIASDTDTIRSHFDDDEICFAVPGDPEDLARKIIEMRDPERRARFAVAAARFNAQHTWEREKARYLALVDSLVSSDHPATAHDPHAKLTVRSVLGRAGLACCRSGETVPPSTSARTRETKSGDVFRLRRGDRRSRALWPEHCGAPDRRRRARRACVRRADDLLGAEDARRHASALALEGVQSVGSPASGLDRQVSCRRAAAASVRRFLSTASSTTAAGSSALTCRCSTAAPSRASVWSPAVSVSSLADGERLRARRVVVAAGIEHFSWRPPEYDGLPPDLVSHTVDHRDLSSFAGKRVIVVGGGQSGLESAALLHEAGAEVEVLVKKPFVVWLTRGRRHNTPIISPMLYAWPDVGPAGGATSSRVLRCTAGSHAGGRTRWENARSAPPAPPGSSHGSAGADSHRRQGARRGRAAMATRSSGSTTGRGGLLIMCCSRPATRWTSPSTTSWIPSSRLRSAVSTATRDWITASRARWPACISSVHRLPGATAR